MSATSGSHAALLQLRPPAALAAAVRPPGSKSLTNRALLLASLAQGRSRLSGVLDADDTRWMRRCVERLGVEVADRGPAALEVEGRARAFTAPTGEGPLYAGSAGTVARFLTAVIAARPGLARAPIELDASAQLRARPIAQLLDALREQGADIRCLAEPGFLPIAIGPGSRLRGGDVEFARPASSQIVSAMLLAASFSEKPTRVLLREGTPARPYVEMTIRMLEHFGGCAHWIDERAIAVEPRALEARACVIEPDASSASYFLGLAAIHGGEVAVPGLGSESLQGDAHFCRVLEQMGARVEQSRAITRVRGGSTLRGVDCDLGGMPDMTLTLAVAALFAEGPTQIRGVEVLRHHESDRLAAAATELRKLGARVEERADGLRIDPPRAGPTRGVEIDCYDDHRMAMAFAMVGDVVIRDPGCVAKTFPDYFRELERLGMVAGAPPAARC
ncbi:MAG TPA: 3-phosphoshikimate 1-carboxyvinyltransferase [Myxococcota bacterium]|nr:3-phosphoshikimate 1-carboxyvinyltransferase [Myxococcota bacterium]